MQNMQNAHTYAQLKKDIETGKHTYNLMPAKLCRTKDNM